MGVWFEKVSDAVKEEILKELNPQQLEAVIHPGGPLLILAGAGSGKTRVLTCRVAYLVSTGADPSSILAITFTNKAAEEMRDRLEGLLGPSIVKLLWVNTFHSTCVRILRREIHHLGYDRSFTVLDRDDQVNLVRQCMRELNIDEKRFRPASVVTAIGRAKDELIGPERFKQMASTRFDRVVADVYERYEKTLFHGNALDFDDLILKTVELFRQEKAVHERYSERFVHILVDEYQDTNHAQYVLTKLLAQRHRNLLAVGDDDQSIYQWRGADIRNILDFEKDFPDATVIKLEQNYRSTQNILEGANCVVSHNRRRKRKKLWTDKGRGERITIYEAEDEWDEARFVVNQIERLMIEKRWSLSDFAVLYRTHAQSRVLEEAFIARNIPYQIVGGLKFYERKEIKDMISYLRLIVNPNDVISIRRVVNEPKRGVGPGTLARLESYASEKGIPVLEAMRNAADIPGISKRAANGLNEFWRCMEDIRREAETGDLVGLLEFVMRRTGYLELLESEKTIEALTRAENLKELISVARNYEAVGDEEGALEDFLAQIALVSEVDTYNRGAPAVTLMTLHSAKGLEFGAVFMVGFEEGIFPHQRALNEPDELEEERRLCYVGMTRAKELLFMVRAWRRMLFGTSSINAPSRFLEELDPDCVRYVGGLNGIVWGLRERD